MEGRLKHVEYALDAAKAREEEVAEMIDELHTISGGDVNRLREIMHARSYRTYLRLIRPYRWFRRS